MKADKLPVVLLVSTGLGSIYRGYESFTAECFESLKNNTSFQLILLKGAGNKKPSELVIGNFKRNGKITYLLSKVIKKEPYWIEQFSFAIAMLPAIIRLRPAVIYYSDFVLGTFLWHGRNWLKFKYKLLFSNGAPNGPPFTRMDHIQQLLPIYLEQACAAGTPVEKQTLLPYAIQIEPIDNLLALLQKKDVIRHSLQLPINKKIIVSVGAINSQHKRMDYVIKEFAALPQDDYFLILLGQIDELSAPVIELANKYVSANNFLIKQVAKEEIPSFLLASDYFILASLNEGLPRVLPEALAAGLLPIVHDYTVTRQTLGHYGVYRNLQQNGQLTNAILEVDNRTTTKKELIEFAMKTYSWDALRDRYINMLKGNVG